VSKKTWIIFVVIVVGLLAGLIVWSRASNPPIDVSGVNVNAIQPAVAASGNIADHVFGKADSKVVLIEYGDFQCPGCGSVHPGIKKITGEYKDSVAFVFRNFPLPATTHPNAKAAATTVEAAGLQGKYWEMHNQVYENQSDWENLSGSARDDMFLSYAKTLGLDETKFKADIVEGSVTKKISFDKMVGEKINVDSTPTFYLDGVKLDSEVIKDAQTGNDDKLRTAIDAELKKAGVVTPTTTN
jgi:protein-disulfide isomerase